MDCIFCKIAEGKTKARVVYEDDMVVAFEDIDPKAPVHTLVIPRKHIATTLDIEAGDEPVVGRLYTVAAKLAREKGIDASGFRLVMNTNADAGQAVYHIHLHLIGGRRMSWPPG